MGAGQDPEKQDRLAQVLYNLSRSIAIGAELLEPFMPGTGEKILEQLNVRREASAIWMSSLLSPMEQR